MFFVFLFFWKNYLLGEENEQIRKYYKAGDVVDDITAGRYCGRMWW